MDGRPTGSETLAASFERYFFAVAMRQKLLGRCCILASVAFVERYFSTVETRQQLLGTMPYSSEAFAAPLFLNPLGRFD